MDNTQDRFDKAKLTERPAYRFTYCVTGSGDFPFDMLRYDAAWPANPDAAWMMADASGRMRSVWLHSYREPTTARWQSFVWSVGKKEKL